MWRKTSKWYPWKPIQYHYLRTWWQQQNFRIKFYCDWWKVTFFDVLNLHRSVYGFALFAAQLTARLLRPNFACWHPRNDRLSNTNRNGSSKRCCGWSIPGDKNVMYGLIVILPVTKRPRITVRSNIKSPLLDLSRTVAEWWVRYAGSAKAHNGPVAQGTDEYYICIGSIFLKRIDGTSIA